MAELLTVEFSRDLIAHVFSYYNIVCNIENERFVRNHIQFIRFTPQHANIVSHFLNTKGVAVMSLLEMHLYTETMDEEKFIWCSVKVLDIFTAGPRSANNYLRCCSLLAVIAAYSMKHGYLNAGRDAMIFMLYVTPYYQMSQKLYSSAFHKGMSSRTII